jgi:hypothetical protein
MGRDSPAERVGRLADSLAARPAAQLLWLVPIAYLVQNLAMPFNHSSEEALLADILRAIGAGERPYRDFIDIYGPFNWIMPSLAYSTGGGRWIAVRIWMIVVQLGVALVSYQLLRRLSSRFYAWIAASMIVALFTKLSAGAFLLAGSLFVCFYLLPPISPIRLRKSAAPVTPLQWKSFSLRCAGLVVFGGVFTRFVLPHYELGYLLHLSLPLLLLLGAAGLEEWRALHDWAPESYLEQLRYRVRHSAIVLASCLATVGIGLLLLWPLGMLGPMVEGLTAVLEQVDYHTPFDTPVYGKPQYRFSQAHWHQLPWLASLALVAVLLLQWRRGAGEAPPRDPTAELLHRQQLLAFFAVTAIAHHVIYPTADLGHLLQSFVPWIGLLALCLSRLEQGRGDSFRLAFRATVGLATVLWIGTIAELPLDLERYRWRLDEGAGLSEHAQYLKLRSDFPRLYDYGDFSSPEFQRDLVDVARFLKEHTAEDDRVWVLTPYMSLYFFADLPMYGEQYRWLVYCMTHGRLTNSSMRIYARSAP